RVAGVQGEAVGHGSQPFLHEPGIEPHDLARDLGPGVAEQSPRGSVEHPHPDPRQDLQPGAMDRGDLVGAQHLHRRIATRPLAEGRLREAGAVAAPAAGAGGHCAASPTGAMSRSAKGASRRTGSAAAPSSRAVRCACQTAWAMAPGALASPVSTTEGTLARSASKSGDPPSLWPAMTSDRAAISCRSPLKMCASTSLSPSKDSTIWSVREAIPARRKAWWTCGCSLVMIPHACAAPALVT